MEHTVRLTTSKRILLDAVLLAMANALGPSDAQLDGLFMEASDG